MKKITLSLCASLIATSSLFAQLPIAKFEISPMIGYNTFDGNSKMQDDSMYGVRATYNANEFYGYRIGYQRADDVTYSDCDCAEDTDVQRFFGQLVINGEEEYNFIPYIYLGLGYEHLSQETPYDVSQAYVDGGLGIKYFINEKVNFNLEAEAMRKFDTNDVDYLVNVGFGYMFGPSVNTPEKYRPSILDENSQHTYNKTHDDAFVDYSHKSVNANIIAPVQAPQETIVAVESQPVATTASAVVSPVIIEESAQAPMIITGDGSYYIQMAAWFDQYQDDKLITRLDKSGENFIIYDTVRHNKNAQVVLVGPYASKSDAAAELSTLKRIKKDAFITTLK